jgi:hypothetical protein
VPEPSPSIEIDGKEEYELEDIRQSEYRFNTLHYCVKYKGYSAEQSEWLLAENIAHAQDMVCKFHTAHTN